jgi:diadenosine tetraphosphate (Ap4A) HIT family hydrolase
MTFTLHPDFKRDIEITQLPLSLVLLKDDARFPWLILIPRRAGAREWFDLGAGDLEQFNREIMHVAKQVAAHMKADKMNIAALGNITPQLHAHVIARFKTDAAWPNPIWNTGAARPYSAAEKARLITDLRNITKM